MRRRSLPRSDQAGARLESAGIKRSSFMAFIADRVAQARAGTNPYVIARLPSGWAVIGDVQFLPGYCLLLGDPVVSSLNDLSLEARGQFLQDMVRIGDAI